MIFCLINSILSYAHSPTLPELHGGATLPLCCAWPHLHSVPDAGLELHPWSLLLLQIQSTVKQDLSL